MKLTIDKSTLLSALERVVSTTDQRSPLPALSHVKLSAGESLWLSTTTLGLSQVTSVAAKVADPGHVCVNCKELISRVKNLPDGDLKISQDDTALTIESGRRKFVLYWMPGDDFPEIAQPDGDDIELPSAELTTAIATVKHAMSQDPTRINLNGLCLEFDGGLRAIATNGHRMAVCNVDAEVPNRDPVLVPVGAVQPILSMCEEADGEQISVTCSNQRLWFVLEDWMLSFVIPDATFVPWRQVVPDRTGRCVTTSATDLLASLRAMSVTMENGSGTNACLLEVTENEVRVSGNKSLGNDVVDADTSALEDKIRFGADWRYLCDAIAACGSSEIRVENSGELAPILIEPDTDEPTRRFVVMPTRI